MLRGDSFVHAPSTMPRCRLLLLDTLILSEDGGFQRPNESEPLFPKGPEPSTTFPLDMLVDVLSDVLVYAVYVRPER